MYIDFGLYKKLESTLEPADFSRAEFQYTTFIIGRYNIPCFKIKIRSDSYEYETYNAGDIPYYLLLYYFWKSKQIDNCLQHGSACAYAQDFL